MIFLNNLN